MGCRETKDVLGDWSMEIVLSVEAAEIGEARDPFMWDTKVTVRRNHSEILMMVLLGQTRFLSHWFYIILGISYKKKNKYGKMETPTSLNTKLVQVFPEVKDGE